MTEQPIDITRLDTAALVFPSGDVLSNEYQRTKRSKRIHSATYVGNIRHEKVAIVFQTETAIFKVHAPVVSGIATLVRGMYPRFTYSFKGCPTCALQYLIQLFKHLRIVQGPILVICPSTRRKKYFIATAH